MAVKYEPFNSPIKVTETKVNANCEYQWYKRKNVKRLKYESYFMVEHRSSLFHHPIISCFIKLY